MSSFAYLIPVITFGFAAAAQPGPLSLYLISKTLQNGFRKTFPAVFTPLITDPPVAVVCLTILASLPSSLVQYLQIPGGLFIIWLAYKSAIAWKNKETATSEKPAGRTLKDAIIINILNPNAYIGWSLVIGPMFMNAWKVKPSNGILVLIAFYVTMLTLSAIILLIFDKTRERGPKLQHILLGLSAIFLAFFGVMQLWKGFAAVFA